MKLPKEMIYEIYSLLGNTDKRRLRQTSKLYHIKFKEKDKLEELIEDGYDIPDRPYGYYIMLMVEHGRLDCLRILHQKTNIDNLCMYAAQYGNVDILKWAHEHGHSWNLLTCIYAANGHLDCLIYAYEHGCPYEKHACEYAARNDPDCLAYVHLMK